MPPKRVECEECGLSLLKSNLSRHMTSHLSIRRVRASSADPSLYCRSVTVSHEHSNVPSDQRATSSDKQQGAKSSSSRSSSFRLDSEPGIRTSATRTAPTPAFTLEEYLIAHAAAAAVSEQHQDYNLQGLCDFVARQYPIIPAHARPYLVIGAVAGAQHAAQIHLLAETHGASQEEYKREIAVSAKCSLSNWVIGLRGEPIFPRQQCRHDAVIESNRVWL
jgi:hypothetical protein